MDKQHANRLVLVPIFAIALLLVAGCGDDGGDDNQTACEAAQELEGSLEALGDAEPGDLSEAASTVSDDFQAFVDRAADASRDEIQALQDSVGELSEAVADDEGSDQVEAAIDDVDEAWGGLVDMVDDAATECDLDADLG